MGKKGVTRPGGTNVLEFNSRDDKVGPTQQRPTEGNAGAAEAQVNHANVGSCRPHEDPVEQRQGSLSAGVKTWSNKDRGVFLQESRPGPKLYGVGSYCWLSAYN